MKLTVGDRIMITEGFGKGQFATIKSRDGETGLFLVERDEASQLQWLAGHQFQLMSIDMDRLLELFRYDEEDIE